MMGKIATSRWLQQSILNTYFKNGTPPQIPKIYIALYINDPTDADNGTEIIASGTAYVRQEVSFGNFNVSADGTELTNNVKIEFPIATADWGIVKFIALRTGIDPTASFDQQLISTSLITEKQVDKDDRFSIEVGELKIKVPNQTAL